MPFRGKIWHTIFGLGVAKYVFINLWTVYHILELSTGRHPVTVNCD